MMRVILLLILSIVSISILGQARANPKVIYRYKKFEKFVLDDLVIDRGGIGTSIDISERYRRKFQNKLPEKKNFNVELIHGVQTIK